MDGLIHCSLTYFSAISGTARGAIASRLLATVTFKPFELKENLRSFLQMCPICHRLQKKAGGLGFGPSVDQAAAVSTCS